MRVTAIFDGFYGNELRLEGSIFDFEEGLDALASWMVPVKTSGKNKPQKAKETKVKENKAKESEQP